MATTPKCNNGWQTCACTLSSCLTYDGSNLPNTGIKTGDSVTLALQKIDNALNPLTITQTILSTLESNSGLYAQFCAIISNCAAPEEILLQENGDAILQEDSFNILL